MLLQLKNKVIKNKIKTLLYISSLLFLLTVIKVGAQEQNLHYHGFFAQGLIDVNHSNFVTDNGELSPKLTELGINVSYQLNTHVRLAGQVVYLNGGNRYAEGVRVDYALVDWSIYKRKNWQANLFFGRFKNNHWLYSSSRDVPFARPSILIPQSVYFDGFRDIAVGADGVALKVSRGDDNYGNFDFNLSYGTSPISTKQATIILSDSATGSLKQDFDLQASLYWQPALSSWRFGVSYLDSIFSYQSSNKTYKPINDQVRRTEDNYSDGDFSFHFYTVNALYEGERWELSAEIYQEVFKTKGFYQPEFVSEPVGQGAYVQSRYKVNNELTLLTRYEHFYNDKNDKTGKKLAQESNGFIPAYFAYHKDTTLGLSYDFSNNLRLRFEYHWFQGAGRLTPVVRPNPQVNDNKNWQLWAMQLMYWF